jgi:hypothetical protein
MTGAPGRLPRVQSRSGRNFVQRSRQCDARTGNLQMNGWTMRSDKPSPPVTRYRSFKMFEGAESKRVEANEVSQLASAMLATAFAAVMLVAGQLYIENKSARLTAMLAAPTASPWDPRIYPTERPSV